MGCPRVEHASRWENEPPTLLAIYLQDLTHQAVLAPTPAEAQRIVDEMQRLIDADKDTPEEVLEEMPAKMPAAAPGSALATTDVIQEGVKGEE